MRAPSLTDYLPEHAARVLCKLAEENAQKKTRLIGPALAGVLGMGAGTLAGAGAAHVANKAYAHYHGGKNIPVPYLLAAAPLIGGGLGLAYNLAQAHQIEEMRRALEDHAHEPKRGVR